MKTAFEDMLLPFAKTDKALLPPRMDKAFRRSALRQLELLERRQLCREILLTDMTPLPKNDFTYWSDDGREWREGILHATALERLIAWHNGKPVYQRYLAKMPICAFCSPGIFAPQTAPSGRKTIMPTSLK